MFSERARIRYKSTVMGFLYFIYHEIKVKFLIKYEVRRTITLSHYVSFFDTVLNYHNGIQKHFYNSIHILSDGQRVLKAFEALDSNVSVFTVLTFSERLGKM